MPAAASSGVGILVSAPVGTDLRDVTVRNCHVEGFLNSLQVDASTGSGPARGRRSTETTSSGIVVETVHASKAPAGVGIFVDGYVTGVTLRAQPDPGRRQQRHLPRDRVPGQRGHGQPHLSTTASARTGRTASLRDVPAALDLWFWGVGREGISVDGSYDNTIVGNIFTGNSAGGVFLYKNCGEYPEQPRLLRAPLRPPTTT